MSPSLFIWWLKNNEPLYMFFLSCLNLAVTLSPFFWFFRSFESWLRFDPHDLIPSLFCPLLRFHYKNFLRSSSPHLLNKHSDTFMEDLHVCVPFFFYIDDIPKLTCFCFTIYTFSYFLWYFQVLFKHFHETKCQSFIIYRTKLPTV